MTQLPSVPRPPLARRPVFWLLLGAAVLLVVIAVVLGFALTAPLRSGDDAAATAGPTSAPPLTATDAATAPMTEAPAPPAVESGVVIPGSCDGIYTRDWSADFAPLVLNPAWTETPDSGVRFGSRDEFAVAMLESTTVVTCKWGSPNGASDRGVTTNVARIDPRRAAEVTAHFETVGYRCYEELDGMRCVTETEPSPDGQAGESHFLRDDVWVATLWVNAGPDGYTHDIVAAIFG